MATPRCGARGRRQRLQDFGRRGGSAIAAAVQVAAVSLQKRPDAGALAVWLADAVLAHRLKWPAPVPLIRNPAREATRRTSAFGNYSIAALSGHPVVKYHDTDVGFLCPLPLPVFLEEDKGPDHDVLAASGVGGRGRVDTGSMERPARDGAVGRRVIALEH